MTTDLEDRLRTAMEATAGEIAPGSIEPFSLGRGPARREPDHPVRLWPGRPRLAAPLAAAVAVIAVVAAALAVSSREPGNRAAGTSPGAQASSTARPASAAAPSPTPASPAAAISSVQGVTSVNCDNAIIDAVSGNPVTDCAAIWKQSFGTQAPQLAAYADGAQVVVLPMAAKPWAGSVRLPAGVVMNTRLIVLNEWLQDYVSGLSSRCYADSRAVTAVRGELASLGLSGWSVPTQPPAANGHARCADVSVILFGQRQVRLLTSPSPSAGKLPGQLQSLSRSLRQVIGQCDDLAVAATRARAAAALAGLPVSPSGTRLQQVTVANARCTSIYLEVGGTVFLTLRGPGAPAGA